MTDERGTHFQTGGAGYASFRPRWPDALARALAEAAPDRDLAVDVGCGSGQLTDRLAPHFDRTLGCDIAAGQTAEADGPLGPAFARLRGAVAACWPPERVHVETACRDLPFPFPELAFPSSAIEQSWTREHLAGYVETWSATRRARAGGMGEAVDAFQSEAATLLPSDAAVALRFPIAIRATRLP